MRDGKRRQDKVVGQENKVLVGFRVVIRNTPQWFRIVPGAVETGKEHGLVCPQSGGLVHRPGVSSPGRQIVFGFGYKEGGRLMNGIEPCEVQVTAVHYVKGTRFYQEQVQDVDVVYPAFGDMDEFRYTAVQIQKSVEFYGSLGFAELRPRKEFQAQLYGGGIENIGRFFQLHAEIVVDIKKSGYPN